MFHIRDIGNMKPAFPNLRSPRAWFHGLAAAFIGGSASALMADQGVSLMHRFGADVQLLNLKTLAAITLSAGISSAAAYLSKSPLPELEDDESEETTP